MKKVILLSILFMSTKLFAQVAPQNEMLVKSSIYSSGYGAISTYYSKLNGDNAHFSGAYAGWMINHKVMIGLGGYSLVSDNTGIGINTETNEANKLRMGYGGLMAEYTFSGNKLVHLTANTLLGGGKIENGSSRNNFEGDGWVKSGDSGFFVIQPSLNVEANITNWFRIAIGGGYRCVMGAKLNGISNNKMNAAIANVALKFGSF